MQRRYEMTDIDVDLRMRYVYINFDGFVEVTLSPDDATVLLEKLQEQMEYVR